MVVPDLFAVFDHPFGGDEVIGGSGGSGRTKGLKAATIPRSFGLTPMAQTGGRKWTWGERTISGHDVEAAYQVIRESSTDIAAISRYTGYKPERIQRIKDYLFNNPEWTGADPEIAAAWHRLRIGAGTQVDRLLLKHETAEMWLRRGRGLTYSQAHHRANQHWNWQRAIYGD